MILQGKRCIIHGAAGAIGSAVARAFAREGGQMFLAGRTLEKLEALARELRAEGGSVHAARVDALDQESVRLHARAVAEQAGGIDVMLNAVGFPHVQGIPFAELSYDDFQLPVQACTRTIFLTAQAAAFYMAPRQSGVILTLSTPGARLSGAGFLGNGTSSAAVEAMSRILAGELGHQGIRVVCIRSDAIPEAVPVSHARAAFEGMARKMGISVAEFLQARADSATLLGRLPTLAQIGAFAAFAASDGAGAMTGAIANLTCGSLPD
ncbi:MULTISPECIES: SDR family NAD(P)-dependent oxidoreductase [unclassified Duganella]|uniref:SDR family NAD(P)-dependent oxidoreductase n=1 Tax=unclassified Duganella TaxID=2636909 RepID=UPI0006F4FE31|nr:MULTISPECIES: SDR family oxidoreductase [unclassified Duganella]KQV61755.1 short-chain dehydrogenase [Duganella sp. Root336D2]KRB84261.1 short-chain dehydrogenase [Duganella sp. Root198D2]